MKYRHSACLALSVAILLCTGCPTRVTHQQGSGQTIATTPPEPEPGYDHYIAWIPASRASSATVARAMTHVALGNARQRTGTELCAGSSLISSGIVAETGPFATINPAQPGQGWVWYYRVSQRPGIYGCDTQSQSRLYHGLQEHLPRWITLTTVPSSAAPDLPVSAQQNLTARPGTTAITAGAAFYDGDNSPVSKQAEQHASAP